ncbi:MAG: phosphate/phosphite/phosphonate ABC transporter substrate-binding protein, partial [Psychrosphaera sp.]|nr:phosphate/phosphite/phosphonate ABC transporter substrate-binding protein [Psychrosphaera sp.]
MLYPVKYALTQLIKPFRAILFLFLACLSIIAHATPNKTIVFGMAPWDTTENLLRKHQPLMTWLAQKLKVQTNLIVTRDYADLEQQLASGTIQIGFMPAVSYVKAKKNMPGLSILAGVTDQHPVTGEYRDHYRGFIVTLKSSGITTLAGLKNKRFGFTDKDSSSGYKYPIQLLNEKGIEPEQFFSQVFMLKKHPKVTQALLNGAIDGGATFDVHVAQQSEKYGDIFNVIATTNPIPFDAVVASPHFSRSRANQIKSLLLKIKPEDQVLQQMRQNGLSTFGWRVTNDSNYNSVRRVLNVDARDDNIKQLILGIAQEKSAYQMHKMWSALLQHLSDATSIPVTLQVVKDDNALMSRMENGQFDISIFRPFAYVRAKEKLPQLKYLATLVKKYANGQVADHYNGVLISLKSRNINTLADLQNKRFAFTSKSSTSGYLYPLAILKQHKIEPKDYFSHTFMLKKHNKIIKALLSSAIDVGATTDDELYL